MKKMFAAVVMVVSFAFVTAAAQEVKLPPKERFHLFLLMGQSNMAGAVKLADTDLDVAPRILIYDVAGKTWKSPVDADGKAVPFGVGPAMSFAAALAKAEPDVTIGLIPTAVGGTPLASWVKGADLHKKALEAYAAVEDDGTLKGILWHQGESDGLNANDAATYGQRLAETIAAFREELSATKLPFVCGQIGQWVVQKRQFAHAPVVNAALAAIPSQVPSTACAPSTGLAHGGDRLHFTQDAFNEFGRRYAEAYRKLIQQPKQ